MSLSCCSTVCVSVLCRASSIPDICLSSTWTTPFTSSLSFLPHNLPTSLYPLSLSPVTHESLPDLCLSEEHPSPWGQELRGERGGFQIRPMNTHENTHTITPTSSHCIGQSGSLKVRDWSLLLSSGCLSVADSLFGEPARTQIHHVCMCVCMCVSFFVFFSCFELWLQEVPGLQPMVKGLPDSPSLQWGGILHEDYHIISISLASHYCGTAWLCALSSSRPAPFSPYTTCYTPLSLFPSHMMDMNVFFS